MNNIDFYDRNAQAFYVDTVSTDMAPLYDRFLPLVKPGGLILDAGCGSGRDTSAFLERGFRVDAFDGSMEMVRRASELTGLPVKQMLFESLVEEPLPRQYDAVWCCASLLHVERTILASVTTALLNALAPDGVMYVSFKYGNSDRTKDGRSFTDMTEESLDHLLASSQGVLVESWITADQRPGRSDMWLNAIIQATIR